jgi:antitoxin component YwqK of YwqJK toxin-antitoxin module
MTKRVIILSFILGFFSVQVISQEIKKVKLWDEDGNLKTEFSIAINSGDTLNHGVYIEYHPNGKIKDSCFFKQGIRIGTEIYYDKKGRKTFVNEYVGETFPRLVKTKAFYYSGVCRYTEGEMIEKSPGNAITEGIIKYYWKNMHVMDSVIFVNDKKTYRARFNRNGEFQFENKY